MPRLPLTILKPRALPRNLNQTRLLSSSRNLLDSTPDPNPGPETKDSKTSTTAHDAGTSWGGREGRDHAVKRPAHDVQSQTAQKGMKDHEEGKEGSDAISRKDERNSHEKTKEEFPEAPTTIGMNDERGGKGHS